MRRGGWFRVAWVHLGGVKGGWRCDMRPNTVSKLDKSEFVAAVLSDAELVAFFNVELRTGKCAALSRRSRVSTNIVMEPVPPQIR